MKIKLLLILILLLPSLCLADSFLDIRQETTYWRPYRVPNTNVILVLNKDINKLNKEESRLVGSAITICELDRDTTTNRFHFFYENNLEVEGIVTKNFPELEKIKYVADLNEIMLNIKRKINKITLYIRSRLKVFV